MILVRENTFSRYSPLFQVQLSPLHLLRPGARGRRHRHRGQQLSALLFQPQFAGGRRRCRRPADDGRLRPVRLWRPDYRRSKSRALPLGRRLSAAGAGGRPNDGGDWWRRRSRDFIGGGRRPWGPSSGRHSARRPRHEARAEQSRLPAPRRPSPSSREGLKLDTTCCCCCYCCARGGEMKKTTTFHDVVVFC